MELLSWSNVWEICFGGRRRDRQGSGWPETLLFLVSGRDTPSGHPYPVSLIIYLHTCGYYRGIPCSALAGATIVGFERLGWAGSCSRCLHCM
ncbi:hypothetical protein B9Z19DRAFT_1089291 [Tuber borchii]|uniref:Uncharacterized protein n=1 Tax=Tuber borchii TaxID=42251 RepID=A0A2T6ZKI0_TUBBO|nr:hypothetical protein B9Z19DRAFT_1089291 [Tuber borchii]